MQSLERVAEIVKTVVCPACHERLILEQENGAVEQRWIGCVKCRKKYPVEDGIPVLLISRAHSQ